MKRNNFLLLSGLLITFSAPPLWADDAHINQAAAFEQCRSAIRQADPTLSEVEFRRSNAVTFSAGRYKVRFNFNAEADGERVYQKVKCVVTTSGQLELLETGPGSWRF